MVSSHHATRGRGGGAMEVVPGRVGRRTVDV